MHSYQHTCLERLSGHVDRDNHIIRGVSLMRIGPAKGHDMDVDRLTLEQTKALIPSLGLKAKVNHRDAGGVMSLNGRMKNPRIDGNHLRADWHLNPDRSNTPDIEAIAEHQPEDAGISLTCFTTKERKNGVNYMRVSGVKSADLVDDPAANESLLSVSDAMQEEETELEVEPSCKTYLAVAEDENISLAEVERRRRQKVIDQGRAPGASTDQVNACGAEFRRLSNPSLRLTGLEASSYRRAAGVPWNFTMQDFGVSEDEFILRSNAVVRGSGAAASTVDVETALATLAERNGGKAEDFQTEDTSSGPVVVQGHDMTLIHLRAASEILKACRPGLSRALARGKIEREHGPDWQQRLAKLEAAAASK